MLDFMSSSANRADSFYIKQLSVQPTIITK